MSHLHYHHAGGVHHFEENLDDEVPAGTTIGVDPGATVASIHWLKALAAERDYPVIPGHDPDVWPALTAALAVPGPS